MTRLEKERADAAMNHRKAQFAGLNRNDLIWQMMGRIKAIITDDCSNEIKVYEIKGLIDLFDESLQ